MPAYDYWCDNCGALSAWHTMSESAQPLQCPTCPAMAQRRIAAPYIATLSPQVRTAQAPEVVKRTHQAGASPGARHPRCLFHQYAARSPGFFLGAPRASVASGAGLQPGVPRVALA